MTAKKIVKKQPVILLPNLKLKTHREDSVKHKRDIDLRKEKLID